MLWLVGDEGVGWGGVVDGSIVEFLLLIPHSRLLFFSCSFILFLNEFTFHAIFLVL